MPKPQTREQDAAILAVWGDVEAENADHSTMYVIQMTADRAGVSYERVVDALGRRAKATGIMDERARV